MKRLVSLLMLLMLLLMMMMMMTTIITAHKAITEIGFDIEIYGTS